MDNKKEINGRTFAFGHIPPFEAVDVEVAVMRVVGEPLFKAFATKADDAVVPVEGDEAEAETSSAQPVEALGASIIGLMLSRVDKKELKETMTTVFKYVHCDGERLDINKHFGAGRHKDMWLVFIAALRFNFADFFPASLLRSVRAAVPQASS